MPTDIISNLKGLYDQFIRAFDLRTSARIENISEVAKFTLDSFGLKNLPYA